MIRELAPTEIPVLDELATKINNLVAGGTLDRLKQTRLLGDPDANARDYIDFHQRFQLLHTRLQQLRKENNVKVNTALDPAMGAFTPTSAEGGKAVTNIQLPPELLDVKNSTSSTERAITLLHELTHSMFEGLVFPIKDYTYRASWGQGYLKGQLTWRNADTYAEAAAQVAESAEGAPGRYRERGRIRAQREALRLHQLTLGSALAWADIKVNRAWLRSYDYRSFAQDEFGRLWEQTFWEKDPNSSALLALEVDLRAKTGIIGDRSGALRLSLSPENQKTASNVYDYLTRLKSALKNIKLVLSNNAGPIRYDASTKALDIPRGQAAVSPFALGEAILNALVDALNYEDSTDHSRDLLNKYKRTIVDLLVQHDRPFEREQLQQMERLWVDLHVTPSAAPKADEWSQAEIELDLATVQGIAENLTYTAADPAVQQQLSMEESVRPAVDTAVQIVQRLAQLSAAQTQHRKAQFTAMHSALTRIRAAAAGTPEKQQSYEQLAESLKPLMQ